MNIVLTFYKIFHNDITKLIISYNLDISSIIKYDKLSIFKYFQHCYSHKKQLKLFIIAIQYNSFNIFKYFLNTFKFKKNTYRKFRLEFYSTNSMICYLLHDKLGKITKQEFDFTGIDLIYAIDNKLFFYLEKHFKDNNNNRNFELDIIFKHIIKTHNHKICYDLFYNENIYQYIWNYNGSLISFDCYDLFFIYQYHHKFNETSCFTFMDDSLIF